MEHQTYRELLYLSRYDELDAPERERLDAHLALCDECRNEMATVNELHATIANAKTVDRNDEALHDARRSLHEALLKEKAPSGIGNRALDWIGPFVFPRYRIVLGSIALLALGFFLGQRISLPSQKGETKPEVLTANAMPPPPGETGITNVRFLTHDTSKGEIALSYDALVPVKIRGTIDDPDLRRVLTQALVNEQNPGVRLRTVNALAAQVGRPTDPDVKAALILAAMSDRNPGVRREALGALKNSPFDEKVRNAFLSVLMHEPNPAIRITAMDGLDKARAEGHPLDGEIRAVLKQRLSADENEYLRVRARSVLEEDTRK
jgi:anti-sigma factor RsiW